jgi:potassium efflux system protein
MSAGGFALLAPRRWVLSESPPGKRPQRGFEPPLMRSTLHHQPSRTGASLWVALLALVLVVVAPCALPTASAQEQPATTAPGGVTVDPETVRQQAELDTIKRELDQIEQTLDDQQLDDTALTALRGRLDPLSQKLTTFIAAISPRVEDLNLRVAQLTPKEGAKTGTPAAPDTPEVSRLRETVVAARDAAVALLNTANSLQVQATQLANRIADRRRANFTDRVLQRSPSIVSPALWGTVLATTPGVVTQLWRTITSWIRNLPDSLAIDNELELALTALFAVLIALPGRRFICGLVRKAEARRKPTTLGISLGAAMLAGAGVAMPLIAAGLLAGVIDEINLAPPRLLKLLHTILYAPAWVLMARALVHAVFAPGAPRLRLVPASDAGASQILRFTTAAVAVMAVAIVLEAAVGSVGAPISLSVAIRGIAAIALAAMLLALMRRAAQADAAAEAACLGPYVDPGGRLGALARILGWTTGATLGLAALIGYIPLAWFLAAQLLWASALFAMTTIALAVIGALATEMQKRDAPIARFAHLQMGLPERALEQFGALIGGALKAMTLVIAIILFLVPWGVESGSLIEALQAVIFGFSFGGVTISLSSLGVALVLFAAGVFTTRIVQSWLETEFLPTTQIDAGLRNSIRTGVGYLGIFAAAGMALSVLGLSVDRIAIVAGALSVGIGFGLQSIVNNFVSGLILLWERPIRVGDWVVVGAEEGIVRRINVRATEIQTFDRTAVIVPNSTFISGIVKNKILSDRSGRVALGVTVALTEDPVAVRGILTSCLETNPRILDQPPPVVQMKSFGASGIEFEMFGFIADVNSTGDISSELRFAMFECLRENGIALPPALGTSLDTKQLEAAFANLAKSIEDARETGKAERDTPKRVLGRS